jgi:hypothetical protein
VGGTVVAKGSRTYEVPLGSKLDVPCAFQVPAMPGTELEVVTTASKAGEKRFEESRRFTIAASGFSGTVAPTVDLGPP